MPTAYGWADLLTFIDTHVAPLRDAAAIQTGYRSLQDVFGEGLFGDADVRPLRQIISNAVPGNLRSCSALGQQLLELRAEYRGRVFDGLGRRLLSEDYDTVNAVLAELHVLRTLRERDVPVRLLKPTSAQKSADLTIGGNQPTDIEVSCLSVGSAWQLAEELSQRLEILVTPLAREHHLFVHVRCDGFAGQLLRHISSAVERFGNRVRSRPPWEAELAPGITVSAEHCSSGWVLVSGATIRSGDPFANESVLVRLPTKVAAEAPQVRPGGIVFIRTSELSTAWQDARGSETDGLAELVRRLIDVGSRARNVSAVAVLEEVGAASLDDLPPVPAPAAISHTVRDETRQRLLWVPNPHAEREPKDDWRAWFMLPF